jgi:hypothetical protein
VVVSNNNNIQAPLTHRLGITDLVMAADTNESKEYNNNNNKSSVDGNEIVKKRCRNNTQH